jgi:hypothetical protein
MKEPITVEECISEIIELFMDKAGYDRAPPICIWNGEFDGFWHMRVDEGGDWMLEVASTELQDCAFVAWSGIVEMFNEHERLTNPDFYL